MAKSKTPKKHFYIVYWRAKKECDGEVVYGWTEINMNSKWHPDEVGAILNYIANLNADEGLYETMLTGSMYLGKFEQEEGS